MKKIVSTTIALCMMSASTMAAAQTATAPSKAEVAPSSETVQGSEARGRSLVQIVVLIGIILAFIAVAVIDNKESPHSP